jgi:hypothetical protein
MKKRTASERSVYWTSRLISGADTLSSFAAPVIVPRGALSIGRERQKAANRVRITGQLVDTTTGVHLWADRFDGGLGDIFDLQDQVTERVVGPIVSAVEKAEIERARRKPTESLDATA